jgi:hypothetical protein
MVAAMRGTPQLLPITVLKTHGRFPGTYYALARIRVLAIGSHVFSSGAHSQFIPWSLRHHSINRLLLRKLDKGLPSPVDLAA